MRGFSAMCFRNKIKVLSITLLLFSFILSNVAIADSKPEGIKVPIIMYHQVKTCKTGKDVITPWEFESDLKYLKENSYTTITMTDLINYVDNAQDLPEKPIILSFDDGYYNNFVYVYPLLQKYNAKIVLSLIGTSTDKFSEVSDINIDYSHVTWDQINEMIASGLVEVQNHTYNLHKVSYKRYGCKRNAGESLEQYEQVLVSDIEKLQEEITARTGTTPNTFNYPYGRYCDESEGIIKKLGFKASLTCDYGVNKICRGNSNLFGLKRICREHGTPISKLLKSISKY